MSWIRASPGLGPSARLIRISTDASPALRSTSCPAPPSRLPTAIRPPNTSANISVNVVAATGLLRKQRAVLQAGSTCPARLVRNIRAGVQPHHDITLQPRLQAHMDAGQREPPHAGKVRLPQEGGKPARGLHPLELHTPATRQWLPAIKDTPPAPRPASVSDSPARTPRCLSSDDNASHPLAGDNTHAKPVPQRSTCGAETRPQVGPFLAREAKTAPTQLNQQLRHRNLST